MLLFDHERRYAAAGGSHPHPASHYAPLAIFPSANGSERNGGSLRSTATPPDTKSYDSASDYELLECPTEFWRSPTPPSSPDSTSGDDVIKTGSIYSNGGPAGLISSLFRKRHKSIQNSLTGGEGLAGPTVGGAARGGLEEGKEGSPAPPGSKMRGVAEAVLPPQRRERCASDAAELRVTTCAYQVKTESLTFGSRRTGDRRLSDSVPLSALTRPLAPRVTLGGDSARIYSGGRTPPNFSGTPLRGAGRTLYQRSESVQERSPGIGGGIGPSEFVEMYRNRAYSESQGGRGEGGGGVWRGMGAAARKVRQRRYSASTQLASGSWNGGGSSFEPHQVIIWRDHLNGTQVFRLPKTKEEEHVAIEPIDDRDSLMYLRFLRQRTCYDVMPTSTKLVILDTALNVKKAFYALVYNGICAAPLWDSGCRDFVGMLTITDFIRALVRHHNDSSLKAIEEEKIENWIGGAVDGSRPPRGGAHKPLLCSAPECSLLDAVHELCARRVHRLPVIDAQTGNVLYTLTHRRILRYVFLVFQQYDLPHPTFMNQTIGDLGIGTYDDIATVEPATPLISALQLFLDRRISALPVVDENRKLLGVYAKLDVMNLASENTYATLDVSTVEQAMNNRTQGFESVERCSKTETLGAIVERLVKAEVHRLVVVDGEGRVEGVVSLSDVVRFLVLDPPTLDLHPAPVLEPRTLSDRLQEFADGSEEMSRSCFI